MACATLKRPLEWDSILSVNRPAKRRRFGPFCTSPTQREKIGDRAIAGPSNDAPKTAFPALSKKLTAEYMAENLRAHLRRMQKRKQLQQKVDNTNEGGDVSPSRSDKALFTFQQVNDICESMLKERESEIREEYDQVLTAKLAEQYDAFVKFTYDQIHNHYNRENPPSYLS